MWIIDSKKLTLYCYMKFATYLAPEPFTYHHQGQENKFQDVFVLKEK